jgi:hypothetical protein
MTTDVVHPEVLAGTEVYGRRSALTGAFVFVPEGRGG